MATGDSRKDYIFSTVSNIFGNAESSFKKDDDCLNTFLDDGNSTVLATKLKNGSVTFSNKVLDYNSLSFS